MSKEFDFFIFLLEMYADHKGVMPGEILKILKEKQLMDTVVSGYEMYHQEALQNAFDDLDSLIATGKPAF